MSRRSKKVIKQDIGQFIRQYQRPVSRFDPNDRQYSHKLENIIKRMDPGELSDLLYGDDSDASADLIEPPEHAEPKDQIQNTRLKHAERILFSNVQILLIDDRGVDYIDQRGEKKRISFPECIANWKIEHPVPISKHQIRDWTNRVVGFSAHREKRPYIEFSLLHVSALNSDAQTKTSQNSPTLRDESERQMWRYIDSARLPLVFGPTL